METITEQDAEILKIPNFFRNNHGGTNGPTLLNPPQLPYKFNIFDSLNHNSNPQQCHYHPQQHVRPRPPPAGTPLRRRIT
jgi:hypothetical protein